MARFGDSVQSGGAGEPAYGSTTVGSTLRPRTDPALRPGDWRPHACGKPEVVVQGLPLTGDHPMHPFAIDSSGGLYIDLGSATNACQVRIG